ncbi:MAG: discoidin domain-containing protein [Eubacteriales bacterium]|nr:discoidin domain-containing protein [Eubacteriales bacterium]
MTENEVLSRTQEFFDGKYGVMQHFLGDFPLNEKEWNERVNDYDCQEVARQLHEVGAAHFLFSMSQVNGYFPAPNVAYTRLMRRSGFVPHCSERDLIADLYEALAPYGIKLFLFMTVGGPRAAYPALFPWSEEEGPLPLLAENWFPMLEEYSLRYGNRVAGWWVTGCFSYFSTFRTEDHPFTQGLVKALRSGNPDALIALNSGSDNVRLTKEQDLVAGERDGLDLPPYGRLVNGMQSHVVTYLGPYYAAPGVVCSNVELVRFVKRTNEQGGVVTLDAAADDHGHIVPEHMNQLSVIRTFIRERARFQEKEIPESEEYLRAKRIPMPDPIPADYVNVAYGKKCTATSYFRWAKQSYPPEAAIDGSSVTGWAPAADDRKGMYWTLDLGEEMCVDAISYVPRKNFSYERRNFEIIASLMPDFSAYTTLLYQGDIPLPLGVDPARVFSKPVYCRYIRMRPTKPNVRVFIVDMKIYVRPERLKNRKLTRPDRSSETKEENL